MQLDILFLDVDRRTAAGAIWDVIDYRFKVQAEATVVVAVGITGQFHDPAPALGNRKLSQSELAEAAAAWLRSRIDRGECDPFNRPGTDTMFDVPTAVMQYWIEHHALPVGV